MLAEITNHTGTKLLPQVLLPPAAPHPKGLGNISMSTLQWPTVALPSKACWQLWMTMIQMVYMGSRQGTRLQQPLGPWLLSYDNNQFWNWQLHDARQLVFQHSPTTVTCVSLQTQNCRMLMKFSPTVLTTLPFSGPLVTPIDPTTCYVRQPVPPPKPNCSSGSNTFCNDSKTVLSWFTSLATHVIWNDTQSNCN